MKIIEKTTAILCLFFMISACNTKMTPLEITIFETSANGNQLTERTVFEKSDKIVTLNVFPKTAYQTITGFGGS
ncbi:MAG: glucosylceramidase, partial [Marivirga sp.]